MKQLWECPTCGAQHRPALRCMAVECYQKHKKINMKLIEGEYPPAPKKEPVPSRPKAGRIRSLDQLTTLLKGMK